MIDSAKRSTCMADIAGFTIEKSLGLITKIVCTWIENGKWKELFVDNGRFFTEEYIEREADFRDSLRSAFSEANMKQIALKLRKEDSFSFLGVLENVLRDLMKEYDIPEDTAAGYVKSFKEKIFADLKREQPDVYERLNTAGLLQKIDREVSSLKDGQNAIQNKLEIITASDVPSYTMDVVDQDLRDRTENPQIGLDFFDIDDKEFKRKFEEAIAAEKVYIKGKCKEEILYCILNELQGMKQNRPVFIVRSRESWEWQRGTRANCILIPAFFDEEILAVKGNTNIFIYGETEACPGRDPLVLRLRTRGTIRNALRRAGADEDRIQKLMASTHGLFVPLMRQLIRGGSYAVPAWVSALDEKTKMTALLAESWVEEVPGDRQVVEQLYGGTYEEFLTNLRPGLNAEEPLICRYKSGSGTRYYLAGVEDAWERIDPEKDEIRWRTFLEAFLQVFTTEERLFAYDREELWTAQLKGERYNYSETLRRGLLRALIMRVSYEGMAGSTGEQARVDGVIGKVFDWINSAERWKEISRFFSEFCEISPDVVMSRVERELTKSSGLLEMMQIRPANILERNDAVQIVFGMGSFMLQERYASRAMRWFTKLDQKIPAEKTSDLDGVFEKVLCPWYHFSAFNTVEKKTAAAGILLEKSENAWDRIFKSLPFRQPTVVGTFTAPRYREHVEIGSASQQEMLETVYTYIDMLTAHTAGNPERWTNLLHVSFEFPEEQRSILFMKLEKELPVLSDIVRMKIKNSIRREISKHRQFVNSSWAAEEKVLSEYEALFGKIILSNPEYEYVYLFSQKSRDILLHPVPYGEDGFFEKNEELINQSVQEGIEDFQKRELDLHELAEACAKDGATNTLGSAIAKYWKPFAYSGEICAILFAVQKSGKMAVQYIWECSERDPSVVESLLDEAESSDIYNDEILLELYKVEARCCPLQNRIPRIQNAHEKYKREFWGQAFISFPGRESWALQECKQFGTVESFLELLYFSYEQKSVGKEELYNYLDGVEEMRYTTVNDSTGYLLGELLKPVQEMVIGTDDNRAMRIAQIEMVFNVVLGWDKMKCFRYYLQKSPELYLQMVEILYYEDDTPSNKRTQDESSRVSNVYNLFSVAQFCPGENNGAVPKENLFRWVEAFQTGLRNIRRESLFGSLLGRVLANSPIGQDGYEPAEAVRDAIERWPSEDLIRSYRTATYNKRGVFTVTGGDGERQLAERYRRNAEYLNLKWPQTAQIYYGLCQIYLHEAESERSEAEHEG